MDNATAPARVTLGLSGVEMPAGTITVTTHDLLRSRIRHNWANPSLSIVVIHGEFVCDGANETEGANYEAGFYFVPFDDHAAANEFCNSFDKSDGPYVTVWVDGEVVHENG